MHPETDILDAMIDLRAEFATLPTTYRKVVYLRYEMDYNQCQIARRLNLSQQRVSQILEIYENVMKNL